jgi:hypothetical protein
MTQIKTGAAALAAIAVLASCSNDDPAGTDSGADEQTTSATPTQAEDCQEVGFHHDVLAPGCWAIKARGLPGSPLAELDLPAGFTGNDAWVWVNADKEDAWGAITLMPVGDVYPDPCTRAGRPPKLRPSTEDFTAALAAQKVTTTTTPVPVSLDGHEGLYLEVSVPAGFDVSGCRGKELFLWNGPDEPGAEPGLVSRFWVLDLDGQPVVLVVHTHADATEETVEKFTEIAGSATFADS